MSFLTKILPNWKNALLAILAAGLLIVAFPDFEWWFTAWFALVPLMWAVEREKESVVRSFAVGWLFGTVFFFGTCWWLTFAPINYAGFPPWLAYSGMVFIAAAVGLFPALFAGILAVLLRRFGSWGFLAAPFVWVFTEFLRYWLTGNNWNAIAYSQACEPSCSIPAMWLVPSLWTAAIGGVLFTTGVILSVNVMIVRTLTVTITSDDLVKTSKRIALEWTFLLALSLALSFVHAVSNLSNVERKPWQTVVAIQPNVPMSGISYSDLERLRQRQFDLAELEVRKVRNRESGTDSEPQDRSVTVVLPESPMNYMYNDDLEFQRFVGDFSRRNQVSVLFNSAEPDDTNGKYFNSAVMVGPDGREVAQYDKIFLLPFGEAVPRPLDSVIPGFVGNFSYGREYDIMPVGDLKAGVMICFESHFGQLSREYVRNGADALIEMTNDGYLGPTPVLRQHLANAIFRAVESNRPVLRVTNVGITAHISPNGDICDSMADCGPKSYTEGTLVMSFPKSDGSQTLYVRYGEWFAWLCSVLTLGLLSLCVVKRKTCES